MRGNRTKNGSDAERKYQHMFKLTDEEEKLFNLYRKEHKISLNDMVMNYVKIQLEGYCDNSFTGIQTENTQLLTQIYDDYFDKIKKAEIQMAKIRQILSKDKQSSNEYLSWYVSEDNNWDWVFEKLLKDLDNIEDSSDFVLFLKNIQKMDYAVDIGKLRLALRARFLMRLNTSLKYNSIEIDKEQMEILEQIFGMDIEQAIILCNKRTSV